MSLSNLSTYAAVSTGTSISAYASAAGQWALALTTTFCAASDAFTSGWTSVSPWTKGVVAQTTTGAGLLSYASTNLQMQSQGWSPQGQTSWQTCSAMMVFNTVPTIHQAKGPSNNYVIPWNSSLTAGSTLLVGMETDAADFSGTMTDFSVTDSQGNSFQKLFLVNSPPGYLSARAYLGMFIAQNVSAGADTVTLHPVGTTSGVFPIMMELSPVSLASGFVPQVGAFCVGI